VSLKLLNPPLKPLFQLLKEFFGGPETVYRGRHATIRAYP